MITAVALPTLGILAIIPAHGHYERLFEKLVPMRYAGWFILAALVFWIPLGLVRAVYCLLYVLFRAPM